MNEYLSPMRAYERIAEAFGVHRLTARKYALESLTRYEVMPGSRKGSRFKASEVEAFIANPKKLAA